MSFPLKFRSGIDFIFISYHGYGQIRYTHGIKQLLLLNGHMLPRTPAPTQWHQQISRKLLVNRVRSINSLFRAGVSVSLYFSRDHFLLIPTTTWYFRFCHALCIWHWLIRKHFDSSFIWGHYRLHFSRKLVFVLVAQYFTATPCWRDAMRSKQLSTVAIPGFQFELYHVVVALSFFLSSNRLVSLLFYFCYWLIRSLTDRLQSVATFLVAFLVFKLAFSNAVYFTF